VYIWLTMALLHHCNKFLRQLQSSACMMPEEQQLQPCCCCCCCATLLGWQLAGNECEQCGLISQIAVGFVPFLLAEAGAPILAACCCCPCRGMTSWRT